MVQLSSHAALVVIDLQKGVVAGQFAPHDAASVVARTQALAARFRAAGAPVILVTAGWSRDGGDCPSRNVDRSMQRDPASLPADWSDVADGLAEPGDLLVTKRQWGAFTGTDLDLQLRRRQVDTIVLTGIATNFGVESTARLAWELGYDVVIAEDAVSSRTEEMHRFAIDSILPAIARIASSEDIGFG
jgi:nicotinamidase-related amidase